MTTHQFDWAYRTAFHFLNSRAGVITPLPADVQRLARELRRAVKRGANLGYERGLQR